MPVYELTPIDLTVPAWQASTRKDKAIVRAASEKAARNLAALRFGIGVTEQQLSTATTVEFPGVFTKDELMAGAVTNPWPYRWAVRCETIEDPRFPQDGPERILDPPGYA